MARWPSWSWVAPWVASHLLALLLALGVPTAVLAVQLTVSWTDNATNESGFSIERMTSPGGTYAVVGSAPANAVSYVDTSVVAGTTYCYRVQAFNSAGASAYSNVACAASGDTTPPAISIASPAPSSTVSGLVTVSVSATDDTGVTRIDYRIDGALVNSFSPPVTTLVWDSTSVPAGAHTLSVTAWDAAGNSGVASASFSTAAPPTPGAVVGDTTLQPEPGVDPGSHVAAGQTYVDPSFLTTILRMTDAATAPGGARVNSSAADSMFNATGTMLYLHHRGVGTVLYAVDRATAQTSRLGQLPTASPTGLTFDYDGARWDPSNASVLYVMVTDTARRELWQVTTPLPTTTTLLHDFSLEVPSGGVASPRVQVSSDGRYLAAAVSSTGSGDDHVVVWDRQTGTSRVLDTPTRLGTAIGDMSLDDSGLYAILTAADRTRSFIWAWPSDVLSGAVTAGAPDYFGGDVVYQWGQAVSGGAAAGSLVSRSLGAPHAATTILSYPRKDGLGDWFEDSDSSRGLRNGSFFQSRFVDAFPWGTFTPYAGGVYRLAGYRALSADLAVPEAVRYQGLPLQEVVGIPMGANEWSYDPASDTVYTWLPDSSNPEANRSALSIFDWRPVMGEIVQVLQDSTGTWSWRRLAHHHMHWTGDPDSTPRGNADPTGAFVVYQSNLDGTPRTDAFLLQVPALPAPAPDATAPLIAFTAPAAGATVSGTIAVSVLFSDNASVTKVEYRLDGTLVSTSSPPVASFAWNTTGVPNGQHTWTATAYDTSGMSAQAALTVGVQNTAPPTVAVTSPTNGAHVGKTVTVSASASSQRPLQQLTVQVDAKTLKSVTCTRTSCSTSFKWNTQYLSKGAHTVTAIVTDTAGVQTVSAPVTVYK